MRALLILVAGVLAFASAQWPQWQLPNFGFTHNSQPWNPFAAFQQQAAPNVDYGQELPPGSPREQQIYGVPGHRDANQKLRSCCRQLKEADRECRRKYCDFNALAPHTVLGYLAECSPKGPTVGMMWDCASTRINHTPCCQAQGVSAPCMVYCETTNGVPSEPAKYIICLSEFNKIRSCFKSHLDNPANPNIKGEL